MRAHMATELFEAGNPQHRLPPDVPLIEPYYIKDSRLTSGEMKAILATMAGAAVAGVTGLFYFMS